MTDIVKVAVIAASGPMALGCLQLLHQVILARKLVEMGANIKRVETQTNHIKDQLMEQTALASHAQGVNDEKTRVATEAKDSP